VKFFNRKFENDNDEKDLRSWN